MILNAQRDAASIKLPAAGRMIGSVLESPASTVRDLGVFVDSDLMIRSHVQRTVSSCFAPLCQLRSIRHSVPTSVFQLLVIALVLNRLDYRNSVLVGLPPCLQSVQNAAARLTFRLRRSEHITYALITLHWLRVTERITL
jgi:hypothetical protein